MKIADLFAELGFKIEGAEQLRTFDDQMKSIAQSARNAALALKMLARTQLPKSVVAAINAQNKIQQAKPAPSPAAAPVQPDTPSAPAGPPAPPTPPPAAPGQPGGQQPAIPSNKRSRGLNIPQLAKLGLGLLGLTSLVGAIKRLVTGLREMTNASRRAALETDRFTSATGLSRRELKQWEYVAAQGNVDKGTIQEQMRKLTAQQQAIRFGEGNATPYLQFGVDWTKDAGEQLRQFFQRTRGLDQKTAEQMGSMLGISPDVVYLRKFIDQAGNLPKGMELSDREQGASLELNAAWQKLTFTIGTLSDKLTADFSPALTAVIGQLKGLAEHLTTNTYRRAALTSDVMAPLSPFIGLLAGVQTLRADVDMMESRYATPRPSAAPTRAGAQPTTVTNNISVTNHGIEDRAVPAQTAKSVQRAVTDTYYSRPPASADR